MKETFRCEYVRCGKAGCRRCPHGPYWYAYHREGEKVRKRYVGRVDPRPGERAKPVDPRERIFSPQTATRSLALSILGLFDWFSEEGLLTRYRELAQTRHPDRGGSHEEMQYINAAYSYLKGTGR